MMVSSFYYEIFLFYINFSLSKVDFWPNILYAQEVMFNLIQRLDLRHDILDTLIKKKISVEEVYYRIKLLPCANIFDIPESEIIYQKGIYTNSNILLYTSPGSRPLQK